MGVPLGRKVTMTARPAATTAPAKAEMREWYYMRQEAAPRRACALSIARAGGAPPAGPAGGGPGAAARGFILRLRGGRNDHPAPSCAHVQALAHRPTSRAVRRATGGTDGDARAYVGLQKGLNIHLRQTSGGGVLPDTWSRWHVGSPCACSTIPAAGGRCSGCH